MDIVDELKEKLVDQNYWEGHEPSEIDFLTYPEVFHLIGKTEDVYKVIVNPVIDDITNRRLEEEFASCPLELNVIKLDASRGLDDFLQQIRNNRPNPEKLNICIIEPFDETAFFGQVNEFEGALANLVFSSGLSHFWGDGKVSRDWNNTHIIVISEHLSYAKRCPDFALFSNKGCYRRWYLTDRINIGITINDKYVNHDFTIEMSRDKVDHLALEYAKELEASGKDDKEFGPTFYGWLKQKALHPGGIYNYFTSDIEYAVNQALKDGLNGGFDTELITQLQQMGIAVLTQDHNLDLANNLDIDCDLSQWPRIVEEE